MSDGISRFSFQLLFLTQSFRGLPSPLAGALRPNGLVLYRHVCSNGFLLSKGLW